MELYIESVLKKQYKRIKTFFETDLKQVKPEEIHDLRLSFKKLRAVAQLLQFLASEKDEPEKLTDWFNRVYKQMGILRDTQVQLQLTQEYEEKLGISLAEIRHFLSQKEKSLYYEVMDMVEDTKVKGKKKYLKLAEYIGRKRSKKQLVHDSNEAIRKQLSLISRLLLSNTVSDEAYHEIRRHLKTAGYIITFIKHDIDENDLIIRYKWLKNPEKELGAWHDRIQFRLMLASLPEEITTTFQQRSMLESHLNAESKHLLRLFRIHYDQLIIELEERL